MSRCILTSVKISRIFKHFFIDFLKFTFVTVDMKRTVFPISTYNFEYTKWKGPQLSIFTFSSIFLNGKKGIKLVLISVQSIHTFARGTHPKEEFRL